VRISAEQVYAARFINAATHNESMKNHAVIPQGLLPGAEPFYYKKGKIGVLLVHGFTSTPQEMHYLGEFFEKNNISVYCPLLSGHGTRWEDMAKTGKQDWLADIDRAYALLKLHCSTIFIGGSSYGANLATISAHEHPDRYRGLILMAMPAHLRFFEEFILRLGYLLSPIKKSFDKWYPETSNVKRIQATKVHYHVVPLKNTKDLLEGISQSRDALAKITIPTIVLQSKTDHHMDSGNALQVYALLTTPKKELKLLPNSYHVFILDKYRFVAFRAIRKFIQENKK
jgi:carboxylesterase